MELKLTAANSVEPNLPTENTDATVNEYCNRKVTIKGNEYLIMTLISLRIVVFGSGSISC